MGRRRWPIALGAVAALGGCTLYFGPSADPGGDPSGGHGGPVPDARPGDPPPDAACDPVGPASGPTNLTVTVWGPTGDGESPWGLQAGAPVVLSHPDGTIYEIDTTGADGVARGVVAPGDVVTAIGGGFLSTLLDVQPGDDLVVGVQPFFADARDSVGSFVVTAPAVAGAVSYAAWGPCGESSGETSTVAMPVIPSCAARGEIAIVAYDGNEHILSYQVQRDVDLVAGGSLTFGAAWQARRGLVATISHVDPGVRAMLGDLYASWGYGDAATLAGASSATGTLAAVDSASSLVRTTFRPDPDTSARQWLTEPVTGDSFTLDAHGRLLPWLEPPHFDPATSRLRAGGNAAAIGDLAEVDLQYGASRQRAWQIVGARFADVALPRFSCGLADLNPRPGDPIATTAVLVDTYGVAAYTKASTRAHAIRLLDRMRADHWPGRSRVSYVGPLVSPI